MTLMRIVCPRRRFAYILTIAGLAAYVLVTGSRPSVVRAALMAGMFLGGYIAERESSILNTLAGAAIIILAFYPYALFHIGFQLSFCSVLYIIIFFPLFRGLWQRHPFFRNTGWGRYLGTSLSVSLCAWLGAAGLVAYYFEYVTPLTIAANLLVVPLIALIVALGMTFFALGAVCPFCLPAVVTALKTALNGMVFIVLTLSRVPLACFSLQGFDSLAALGYYLLISFLGIVWTIYINNTKIRAVC